MLQLERYQSHDDETKRSRVPVYGPLAEARRRMPLHESRSSEALREGKVEHLGLQIEDTQKETQQV